MRDLYTGTFSRIQLNKAAGLTTAPVRVGRGTVQGDTLSPLLFLIYLEPLFSWLSAGQSGYHPACVPQHARPRCLQSALAFADDLALLTDSRDHMAVQFDKLMQYCQWGELSLNIRKCRVSGALHAEAAKGLISSATDRAMLTARLGNAFSARECRSTLVLFQR